ncbi:hypothetical protein PNEG_02485 [Pneumocystis murina B123]|uniref:Anamorsin C-terminal domain-containing protein n=1 Tax=Pneumocystis murina (strain B123) TaxID=1069680 RepID=M7NPF8_PNEMU|nr:hypothetical protein PNEG_02485 [Pneumocystis murina B123]EMR09142.1 hypothetical protein PNEG_02485 [Pneumocystis murina B123]
MGSDPEKQDKSLSNTYKDGESLLSSFFPGKIEDFLLTQNKTTQNNILILLPNNFSINKDLSIDTKNYRADICYINDIYTGSKVLEKELYECFFLISTEQKSLNEFILILNPLLMSIKYEKGGRIRIENSERRNQVRQEAILQGWNVNLENEELIFLRPIIPENAVPLPKKKTNLKKNNYNIKFDNIELINEDDLLEPSDLIPPTYENNFCNNQSIKKKKRCKNCTCGLKQDETEITEKIDKMTIHLLKEHELGDIDFIKASNIISNCGNCYLGDAFRCSKCPYFGMPAFKPGEKIQLKLNDLE